MSTTVEPMWVEIDARQSDETTITWEFDLVSGWHRVRFTDTHGVDTFSDDLSATDARERYEHPFAGWSR